VTRVLTAPASPQWAVGPHFLWLEARCYAALLLFELSVGGLLKVTNPAHISASFFYVRNVVDRQHQRVVAYSNAWNSSGPITAYTVDLFLLDRYWLS